MPFLRAGQRRTLSNVEVMVMAVKILEVEKVALSIPEFCRSTGISRTTFYREVKAGRVFPVKAGRRTLVPAAETHAYLQRLSCPTGLGNPPDLMAVGEV